MSGGAHTAPSKRIEQLDPVLGTIIDLSEPIQDLGGR